MSVDHVHMYVKIPPKLSVPEFTGYPQRQKRADGLRSVSANEAGGAADICGQGYLCEHGRGQPGCHQEVYRATRRADIIKDRDSQ